MRRNLRAQLKTEHDECAADFPAIDELRQEITELRQEMRARKGQAQTRCAKYPLPEEATWVARPQASTHNSRWPDGRPSPARAKTAAVVASMVKSWIAEIVPPAVKSVVLRIALSAADCPLPTINWNVVVGWLMIAG